MEMRELRAALSGSKYECHVNMSPQTPGVRVGPPSQEQQVVNDYRLRDDLCQRSVKRCPYDL